MARRERFVNNKSDDEEGKKTIQFWRETRKRDFIDFIFFNLNFIVAVAKTGSVSRAEPDQAN